MKLRNQLTEVISQISEVRSQISSSKVGLWSLVFGLLFFASSCNDSSKSSLKIDGQQQFADSAVSSIQSYIGKDGQPFFVKSNASYDIVSVIDNENKFDLLLKLVKSEVLQQGAPNTASYTVSANSLDSKNVVKVDWQKSITANDIDYSSKVLIAQTDAVGDSSENTYSLFSLLSGEKLMSYTYGELRVLIPNTSHKRFFGYLSQMGTQEAGKPNDFAEVNYVSTKENLSKISIHLKGNKKIPAYTPEMQMMMVKESGNSLTNDGKSVILTKLDEHYTAKDITGFALQINYYAEGDTTPLSIILPVENDVVDWKNAIYNRDIFELKSE